MTPATGPSHGAPRSHGNELSMRELERQLQELRRDKASAWVGGMSHGDE